jgi:hypothetical protein
MKDSPNMEKYKTEIVEQIEAAGVANQNTQDYIYVCRVTNMYGKHRSIYHLGTNILILYGVKYSAQL